MMQVLHALHTNMWKPIGLHVCFLTIFHKFTCFLILSFLLSWSQNIIKNATVILKNMYRSSAIVIFFSYNSFNMFSLLSRLPHHHLDLVKSYSETPFFHFISRESNLLKVHIYCYQDWIVFICTPEIDKTRQH